MKKTKMQSKLENKFYEVVIPKNNERELFTRAMDLGYSKVIFLYNFKTRSELAKQKKLLSEFGGKAKIGVYLSPKKPNDIEKLSNQFCLEADLIAVTSKDENVIRAAVSSPKIDLVFGIVPSGGRDHTHYRNSNFNQILAALASRNKVSYGISFSYILNVSGKQRALVIGREMQNLKICRKKVNILIASFARDVWELRNPLDLQALCAAMKAGTKTVKQAISLTKQIADEKEFKRSKEFIRPGVRLVD